MSEQKEANVRISRKNLRDAILREYPLSNREGTELSEADLLACLAKIAISGTDEESIPNYIFTQHPNSHLIEDHHAIVTFIDACCTQVLQKLTTDPDLFSLLRSTAACLGRISVMEGLAEVSRNHPVMDVIDKILAMAIGLDKLPTTQRSQVEELIRNTLAQISLITASRIEDESLKRSRDEMFGKLIQELNAFSDKEQLRITRIETRLIATETGLIRANKAKNIVAGFLNESILNTPLPTPINKFLLGPWNDSLQILLTRDGINSDIWNRAKQLTDTLVWTAKEHPEFNNQPDLPATKIESTLSIDAVPEEPSMLTLDMEPVADEQEPERQPPALFAIDETDSVDPQEEHKQAMDPQVASELQKLYRIIEDLPEEIEKLLISLENQSDLTESSMQNIASVHLAILSSEPLDRAQAEPLPCEPDVLGNNSAVGQTLMDQVNQLRSGQWFLVEKNEDIQEHIKLTLILPDLQLLLFTNRIGIKVLQKNFEEFAYLLSTRTVTPIATHNMLSSLIRSDLNRLVGSYVERKRKVMEKVQKRQAEGAERISKIKAMVEANQQHRTQVSTPIHADLDNVNVNVAKRTITAVDLEVALDQIDQLEVGAWLQMTTSDNHKVQCKIAVHLKNDDLYIIVDRTGFKLGEFNRADLSRQIASGNCEVIDSGVKFSDTLEKVVTGLRDHLVEDDDG